ncbi:hypothetical protein MA16_Dca019116 [Dendrobium catenatum]|uniref:Uncharacterized protein n=1 Tax=Dendrobium catenatum TaxID=906689 RepID=A0A2I0W5B8_9ASPA|nr:hypothetical protein MA16_Dca019116 [Dendrobium catenatum]
MTPAKNWLSFPSPLVEMLIPDPLYFDGDGELRCLTSEPPAVKLENFLDSHHSLPLVADLSIDDVVDFSSSMTDVPISVSIDLEDSSSATGNNFLCLAGYSTDSHLALSRQQQPAAVNSISLPVGSVVSCQRTSVYRGVTRNARCGLLFLRGLVGAEPLAPRYLFMLEKNVLKKHYEFRRLAYVKMHSNNISVYY